MSQLIAFDFDGVICNSTGECLVTGYNAWLQYTEQDGFVTTIEEVPEDLAKYFWPRRGFVRTGGQYFTIFHSFENGSMEAEEDFDHLCATYSNEIDQFEQLFFEARDKIRSQDVNHWISLHTAYDGVPTDFKKLYEDNNLYMVTGKDGTSVKTILKHEGIEIAEDRIYDKNAAKNKLAALTAISEKTGIKLSDIIFVDDNINHLLPPKESGCQIFMAGWGYHTDKQLQKAKDLGIEILELDTWYQRLQGVLT